jgi:hypothetical protein
LLVSNNASGFSGIIISPGGKLGHELLVIGRSQAVVQSVEHLPQIAGQ